MLFQNLTAIAERAPKSSGVRQAGVFHSYAELAERAERLAGGFASVGIGAGDTVALLVPNSVELFVCSYALFAIGAVAVPLNVNAAARELHWAADKCEVVVIIARNESLAVAQKLLEDLGKPLPLIMTGDGDLSVAALEKHAPPSIAAWNADQPALYLFSSGSTGRPKIVPHTQGEMIATGHVGTNSLHFTPDDVLLNMLPGHHAFGYMSGLFEILNSEATTVYWSDPLPIALSRGRLLQALAEEKVTVFPAVPFVLDTLAGAPPGSADLSRMRLVYCGGVALKRPIFDKFRDRFGIAIRQSLGMTEAGQISSNDDPDIDATWNSVGRPKTGVAFDILPTPDAIEPGTGELFLRSPALTKGYLRADPASNAVFRDGGMLTGDLGRVDERGNVYVVGRSKLILEVAGQKIDPVEVEDILLTHPAVAEAVVVGVPDPRTGEQRLKAVVVKRSEETGDALIRYSRSKLSAHKVPALVEFRDAIPKSATGKILRGQLLD